MGRTAYFSTGSLQGSAVKGQEDLVYPINHYVNCPTSKVGLKHLTYKGTQWVSGSTLPTGSENKYYGAHFNLVDPRGPEYDPFPSTPAYTIDVEGSRVYSSRILKAVRPKGNDKKR